MSGVHGDRHEDKHVNISKIHDTRVLAYLLDPDSAIFQDGDDEKFKEQGITIAHLSARYLGGDCPYRHTDI